MRPSLRRYEFTEIQFLQRRQHPPYKTAFAASLMVDDEPQPCRFQEIRKLLHPRFSPPEVPRTHHARSPAVEKGRLVQAIWAQALCSVPRYSGPVSCRTTPESPMCKIEVSPFRTQSTEKLDCSKPLQQTQE